MHKATDEGHTNQATTAAAPPADQGADSLALLAAALIDLPPADRARLAAMLLQGNHSTAAPQDR